MTMTELELAHENDSLHARNDELEAELAEVKTMLAGVLNLARQRLAEVWAEGYEAGRYRMPMPGWDRLHNPYRLSVELPPAPTFQEDDAPKPPPKRVALGVAVDTSDTPPKES